jgi:predicted RNA polymerase sigma factor
LIEQAMRSLPDRSRELLVLRELEGLSYRELAAVLGIPMGTVMSSLSRARQAFRRAMDSQLKQYRIPESSHPDEREADEVGEASGNETGWGESAGSDSNSQRSRQRIGKGNSAGP